MLPGTLPIPEFFINQLVKFLSTLTGVVDCKTKIFSKFMLNYLVLIFKT